MNFSKTFGILIVLLLGALNWQLYSQGHAIESIRKDLDELGAQISDLQDQLDSATSDSAADPSGQPLQCEPGIAPRKQI